MTKKIFSDEFNKMNGDKVSSVDIPFDGSINGDKLLSANAQDAIDEVTNLMFEIGGHNTSAFNTGYKWIDGKDIYRKVINTGTLPNTTTKNIAHGITGISQMISLYGMAKDPTPYYVPLPYGIYSTSYIAVYADLTNIVIITGSNRTTYTNSFIILYYTLT